jgi:hypothetical protein
MWEQKQNPYIFLAERFSISSVCHDAEIHPINWLLVLVGNNAHFWHTGATPTHFHTKPTRKDTRTLNGLVIIIIMETWTAFQQSL